MLLTLLIIFHKIKLYYLIEHDANYDKILKESIKLDKYLAPLFTGQLHSNITKKYLKSNNTTII